MSKSNIRAFFKDKKAIKENAFYAVTKSLCEDDGAPLLWEIKPVSTKENERIQEECTTEIPVPGKRGQYRQKMNGSLYGVKLLVASVAFPDLFSAELQDSYGVKTPEALIMEIVDDSGEWNNFIEFVNKFNGFVPIQDEIDDAKN